MVLVEERGGGGGRKAGKGLFVLADRSEDERSKLRG